MELASTGVDYITVFVIGLFNALPCKEMVIAYNPSEILEV